MKNKLKIFGIVPGAVLTIVLIVVFSLGLFGLGWKKFFKPRHENINREVFEQTQSYVHGKIQDLAKYYEEYNKTNIESREAIRSLILIRFAEFDESKIRSPKLKTFLTNMRGY